MEDLISIIVPVYKTEKYLDRCVQSIQRQAHPNIEVILVDDGSPDKSGDLCDALAETDDRIRVIHKQNGGISSARNAGIEASRGTYVCFVDSDDYIDKEYASTLYKMISETDADLAKIDYVEIDTDDHSEDSAPAAIQVYEGEEVEKAFLRLRVDSACVFLYKRFLIGDTRFPEGKTSEDIPFNYHIFQKANKFAYCPVKKYYYWHNPDSISNGPLDRNMLNYLCFREEIYKDYCEKGDGELARLSEVLYARAAMGLMARMALYGISEGMDEKEYRARFKQVFTAHSGVFYRDNGTELSRKALAILVFSFYPFVRTIRRFVKNKR